VFRDLPIGKYALTVNRPGKLQMRQVIEITGTKEKTVTLDLPKGTASLQGTVKVDASEPRAYLQLRSKDNRLVGGLEVKPDGTFPMGGLPAGEYLITQQSVMNANALATFSLAEGERKSIALSETLRSPAGFLRVSFYTADGLPLPGCQVILTGAKGEIPRHSSQSGEVLFVTEPGPYRLSVSYPGFGPVSRQVEVKATQGGRWRREHELSVTLARVTNQIKVETR
jgi:hypothetical protein